MKKSILFKELILVLVTIIWGLGFTAQFIGGSYLDAYTFNFLRNVIASIALLVIVLISDSIRKKKNIKNDNIDYSWNNKQMLIGGVLAGIAITIGMTTQQLGINLEGAGKSGFLTALYIVFVPVFNLFFGKKLSLYSIIAIVLSLVGLYLMNCGDGKLTFSLGTILLLICALGYTMQILAIDKFSKGIDTLKFSLVQFVVSMIITFIISLFLGEYDFEMIVKALPALLFLGILSSGVAYTLQIYAQTEVNVTVACIIMSLESVFALLFGVLIMHEHHEVLELFGCLSILIAVILSQLQPRKRIIKDMQKEWQGKNND